MLKTYLGMLFGRKHILKTIFILFVVALFIKLGFWQLDRLQWRRNLNAQLATQLAQPPTQINDLATPDNLLSMSDQKIAALGHFDYSEQLILKNQGGDVGPGVHLVAPFVLEQTNQAILVDRGWIPLKAWESGDYAQFDEAFAEIAGVVRQYQPPARNADTVQSDPTATELFRLVYDQRQAQSAYNLLPAILQQTPTADDDINTLPYRQPHQVELSEGNHLAYAGQWFIFAIIFGGGYLYYLKKQG